MRAAIQGVSFLPMAGLGGSDLPRRSGFRTVSDPYTGTEHFAIPAIEPDWAIVHVQEADADGNARIRGPKYDDVYVGRAARQLLVTTERLVDGDEADPEPVLRGRPDSVLAGPPLRVPCPFLVRDPPDFSDPLGLEMRRDRHGSSLGSARCPRS